MSATDIPDPLGRVLDMVPPLLADFLSTDVRRDVERCDELLAGLDRARGGEPFEAYGNVYELNAEPARAIIRNSDDPEIDEMHLSLDALANLLRAWRDAVVQAAAANEIDIARSCSASDQPD